MFRNINWIGVIVAAIVIYLIGWLWYDMAFKAQYMAAMPSQTGDMSTTVMIKGFVNTLIAAIGLGLIAPRLGDGWAGGAKAGLMLGFFFACTTAAMGYIYGAMPMSLFPIDMGYLLVSYAIGGAIVCGLRLGQRVAAA
jgi:hypothetical protein